MFNQNDRYRKSFANPPDKFHELNNFIGVHSGSRFIQKQKLGLGGQRPGNLQPALQTVGQVFGFFTGHVVELKDRQQIQRLVGDAFFFSAETADVQQRLRGRVGNLAVVRDADIIQYAQFLEEPDVLKGAGNAQAW